MVKFPDRIVVPGSFQYIDPGTCLTRQNHDCIEYTVCAQPFNPKHVWLKRMWLKSTPYLIELSTGAKLQNLKIRANHLKM